MTNYDEEEAFTYYIWTHYSRFFNPVEAKAAWAVFAYDKRAVGYETFARLIWKRHGLADDPAVMAEIADGIEPFRKRTAHRVFRDHGGEIVVNRCSESRCIVATPKAQQCLWCGFDWHRPPGAALTP